MNWTNFKKTGWLWFVVLLVAMIITGCGADSNTEANELQDPTGTEQSPVEEQADTKVAGHFPATIIDDAGREVTIEEEPQTIISVLPSNTEILFALGAGDRIIGVSDFCNYPAATESITKLGFGDLNTERILELLPDMFFVQDYYYYQHEEILDLFEQAGITVVVVGSAESFDETYASIQMVADAVGVSDQAEVIILEMKQRLETVKEQAKQVTEPKVVWIEVQPAPNIFTTGQGTYMHEMLELIQAVNAAGDQEGWISLTEEEIVQFNPDVIITTYGQYVDDPVEEVLSRDGWGEIPAVKNRQVFDVDNDTVTRPGPRLIDGVEALAELIYPEIFE